MKLTWNGHSCFTIETAQGTVVTDPFLDGVVPGYGNVRAEAEAVFCSHGHRDHCAKELITLTGKECGVGVEEIHTFHDPEEGKLRGTNIIHIFSAEGLKVAHMGDLGCELTAEQLEKLQGLDAMLVPVGGFYTIDAAQAKALAEAVKPRVVVPMHYRGENFGYEVIGPVEDYLALCDNVVKYEGNSMELTKDTPAQTAVLTYLG